MTFKFPLASSSWDDSEIDAMQRVIASGRFTMGQHVENYERAFAHYLGSNYAVMSNSGSSANLLMVAALFYLNDNPLKIGDEVIFPAVSWSTTYYPLAQYGLKLKFVDIDLHTLNYDLDELRDAVTEETKLIMCVNLLGNSNEFSCIQEIASAVNARIIEDNCESLGAEYNDKKTGTIGLMGSFSSFFSHHISTMEGGMTVTDDEELYHILLSLRAHGWTRNLPKNNKVCKITSTNPFDEQFRFVLPGYNLRPLELSGAIGLEQLKKLPSLIKGRRQNGFLFQEAMQNHPFLQIQSEVGKSSWFGFSLIIKQNSPYNRAELIQILDDLGFETRPIVAGNFARSESIKYINSDIPEKLPNADLVDRNGLFIGNHHYRIDEAIALISNIS